MLILCRYWGSRQFLVAALLTASAATSFSMTSWSGVLRDATGNPIDAAIVQLRVSSGKANYTATSSPTGKFVFAGIAEGQYTVSVEH